MMNGSDCWFSSISQPSSLINYRNKEHVALLLALGELYPAAEEVRAILAPVPGRKKRVLDLGELKQTNKCPLTKGIVRLWNRRVVCVIFNIFR